MVLTMLQETEHVTKKDFTNYVKRVPVTVSGLLGSMQWSSLHLQPLSKVNGLLTVGMFTQALDEQCRDLVDITLVLQDVAQCIHRVDDSPVVAVNPFIGLCKLVELLANGTTSPNRV